MDAAIFDNSQEGPDRQKEVTIAVPVYCDCWVVRVLVQFDIYFK